METRIDEWTVLRDDAFRRRSGMKDRDEIIGALPPQRRAKIDAR
jgi:hypothetical protein